MKNFNYYDEHDYGYDDYYNDDYSNTYVKKQKNIKI